MVRQKKFRIPSIRYEDLERIINLTDEKLELINKRLSDLKQSLRFPSKFITELSFLINVDVNDLENLLGFITEVYLVFQDLELSIEDFIKEFQNRIIETGKKELIPPNNEWSRFNAFWKKILTNEQIEIMTKATGLMIDLPHLYIESRILSDIRTIFSKNVEEEPKTGIIIHNLRITYQKEGRMRSFQVSLSSDDLKELKKTIERAKIKDQTLEKSFIKKGLTILNDREDGEEEEL